MDKQELEENLIQFRDDIKKYQEIVYKIWDKKEKYNAWEEIEKLKKEEEIPLREKLIESFGKLEHYLVKMGLSTIGTAYNRSFPIFDCAFEEELFENPVKYDALRMAVQMAIKAVGVVKSLDDRDLRKITKKTTTVFISYNFAEKNKELVEKFIDFIEKFNVSVSRGSEVDTISISDKVKAKIDDADLIIAIMTKDEQSDKGEWSPSKWVIEELAYSLANKQKEIIRLLENGCITNGRIFGDKEFIPFERNDISGAITKLAEIINKKI